mgnify:FL=1
MRATQFLKEYQDAAQAKQEIISAVDSLDPNDEEQLKLIDRVYSLVNKTGVVDRFLPIVQSKLAGEYKDEALKTITAKIVSSDRLNLEQKNQFLDLFQANKCVNADTFIKDGHYGIKEIFNGPLVEQMFLEFIDFGAGQARAGKGEHALAILSQDITQKGTGDIDVNGVAVELKVSSSTKSTGSGRMGEGGISKDRGLAALAKFPELDESVQSYFAGGRKTMNVESFTSMCNEIEFEPGRREALGKEVFNMFFQQYGDSIVNVFKQPNANPAAVLDAYIEANFEWYKANPDMGGKWNNISSLALSTASMVTCSTGRSVVQMMRGGQIGKNTPYVIVSQGPDAFFQINPARK